MDICKTMATILRDKFFFSILIGYIIVMCDMMLVMYRYSSSLNKLTFVDQVIRKDMEHNAIIEVNDTNMEKYREEPDQRQLFDCGNIQRLELGDQIGQGVTKKVYLATYESQTFAVKMATKDVKDITDCIVSQKTHGVFHYLNSLVCFDYTSRKILTEILLLHQIYHPSFARLVGYCFKSHEVRTNVISEHGVVSVFEYGKVVTTEMLNNLTWQERMKHAYQLADLLHYAEDSPVGPLLFPDLKLSHLIDVAPRFKLIDLDGIINHEPSCDIRQERQCRYDVPCVHGYCKGYNAKLNMELFVNKILTPMFAEARLPAEIKPGVYRLLDLLQRLELDAAGVKRAFKELFDLVNPMGATHV